MQKILSIVIKASQDFIRHSDEDLKDNAPILNNFYEAISNVYIPLLRMLEKLEAELKEVRENIALYSDAKDKESNMEEYIDMRIKEKELQMEISKKQSARYCAKRRQEINKLKKDLKNHKKKILDNVIKSKGIDLEKLIKAAENM